MTGLGTRSKPSPGLTLELIGDAAREACRRSAAPLRVGLRRNWFYRRLLGGTLADHIAFHPYDAVPRRLEDADGMLRGRFRLAGETVHVADGDSVFDAAPPSRAWAEALHGFAWLPPLALAGGDASRILATNLVAQWVKRHGRYSEPVWSPHIMGRRLAHIFAHGRMMIVNSDMLWRSRLFVSLREQSKMLARIAHEAPEGLPRIEAAAALTLSGVCLDDDIPRRMEQGLARLESEVARLVLPDGGFATRSPDDLLGAYRQLQMVLDALSFMDREPPHVLRAAQDRMAPMIRFFRHGDGGLSVFNGGGEGDPRMIAGLLARDEVRGQPHTHARHAGYQRLAAGKSIVVQDCGAPARKAFSARAHMGLLAFEFSAAAQRIVVNCGAAGTQTRGWESALRTSAAHSTVTLADASPATILQPGLLRDLAGPRLTGRPVPVDSERRDTGHGWCVESWHDGWVPVYGVRHERRLTLESGGHGLTGQDRLVPPEAGTSERVPFAIRFHIHPDIRLSPNQGGGIILKLPNGDGWRFRAGMPVAIEESVYVGGGTIRRAEQLVLNSSVKEAPVEIAWIFETI